MNYILLKHIHVTTVLITIAFFALRGYWMLRDSPQLHKPWVKVLPHLVDTLLLVSGLALAWMIRQYPFESGWLTAKLLGLILYIGLGTVALKRGRTRTIRAWSLVLALVTFGYIVSVALTKTPYPWVSI